MASISYILDYQSIAGIIIQANLIEVFRDNFFTLRNCNCYWFNLVFLLNVEGTQYFSGFKKYLNMKVVSAVDSSQHPRFVIC